MQLIARQGILALFLSVLYSSPGWAAKTYDLAADWSDSQNPNGRWSYNYGATPFAASVQPWAPWAFEGASDQKAWAKGAGANSGDPSHTPAIFKLTSTPSAGEDMAAGDVIVHGTSPGGVSWTNEPSNITWTSDTAGTITITGGVWYAHESVDRNMDWKLYVKGNVVESGNVGQGDAYSRTSPFPFGAGLTFDVAPGDVVKLELLKGSTSQYAAIVGVTMIVEVDEGTPPAGDASVPPASDAGVPPASDASAPPAGDASAPPAGDASTPPQEDSGGCHVAPAAGLLDRALLTLLGGLLLVGLRRRR